jgi:hypothetical protein
MLFAGALGGYFAYRLGVDAELQQFEDQARAVTPLDARTGRAAGAAR